jgi:hypothetical protein
MIGCSKARSWRHAKKGVADRDWIHARKQLEDRTRIERIAAYSDIGNVHSALHL